MRTTSVPADGNQMASSYTQLCYLSQSSANSTVT